MANSANEILSLAIWVVSKYLEWTSDGFIINKSEICFEHPGIDFVHVLFIMLDMMPSFATRPVSNRYNMSAIAWEMVDSQLIKSTHLALLRVVNNQKKIGEIEAMLHIELVWSDPEPTTMNHNSNLFDFIFSALTRLISRENYLHIIYKESCQRDFRSWTKLYWLGETEVLGCPSCSSSRGVTLKTLSSSSQGVHCFGLHLFNLLTVMFVGKKKRNIQVWFMGLFHTSSIVILMTWFLLSTTRGDNPSLPDTSTEVAEGTASSQCSNINAYTWLQESASFSCTGSSYTPQSA
jgi:hypothetical protein